MGKIATFVTILPRGSEAYALIWFQDQAPQPAPGNTVYEKIITRNRKRRVYATPPCLPPENLWYDALMVT